MRDSDGPAHRRLEAKQRASECIYRPCKRLRILGHEAGDLSNTEEWTFWKFSNEVQRTFFDFHVDVPPVRGVRDDLPAWAFEQLPSPREATDRENDRVTLALHWAHSPL